MFTTFETMLSFFSNRKPKQFNYKPQYQKSKGTKEEEKSVSFRQKKYADAMYDRYDRVPFTDLKKAGKQRMMIKASVLAVILVVLIIYIERIEELLQKLD